MLCELFTNATCNMLIQKISASGSFTKSAFLALTARSIGLKRSFGAQFVQLHALEVELASTCELMGSKTARVSLFDCPSLHVKLSASITASSKPFKFACPLVGNYGDNSLPVAVCIIDR